MLAIKKLILAWVIVVWWVQEEGVGGGGVDAGFVSCQILTIIGI